MGIKDTFIIATVAFVVGSMLSGYAVHKIEDAEAKAEEIKRLKDESALKDKFITVNGEKLAEANRVMGELRGVANGLEQKISAGDCFDDGDASAIQRLLQAAHDAVAPNPEGPERVR